MGEGVMVDFGVFLLGRKMTCSVTCTLRVEILVRVILSIISVLHHRSQSTPMYEKKMTYLSFCTPSLQHLVSPVPNSHSPPSLHQLHPRSIPPIPSKLVIDPPHLH